MFTYPINYQSPLFLGKTGENGVTEINFNIQPWLDKYGAGQIELLVRRPGETTMYPVILEAEEGIAKWLVSEIDVAIPGEGECELNYLVEDGKVAKSSIFTTNIKPTLNWEKVEIPEQPSTWQDLLKNSIAEAEAHALWTLEVVGKLVEKGLVTPQDFKDITGEDYI